MRLTKIKLAGFKSFVDPTTIHVPSNLVGIVGPNGCGKSNTIDAVRWVMGESSAKHLRGDSMADVIFNGSTARKPVGHAHVELVFDNSEGKAAGQYAQYNEISIKRQVSRDGQSTYYLNNTKCRRRDITDIFLGTGLGPRSYSIIEQGMISRLIEAKPEDLRVFLEEAAGISKYKERRRETENRIRHTRENLDRLNDLREEIEKQIDKLQRQARTAERYKEYKEQERRVKAELLALRYRKLRDDSSGQERTISEQEVALEGIIADQRAIEAAMEKGRDQLTESNDQFNEVQSRFYGVGAEIARLEQDIQHGRETRQNQEQELGKARKAWEEVEAHIKLDTGRLADLARDLSEQSPNLEVLQERAEQSGASLAEAEQAMQQWQSEWEEFNQRAAEPAQIAQVERTRIDHLERQLNQLADRVERIQREREQLSGDDLDAEIETLTELEEERSQRVEVLEDQLQQALARITELRETERGQVAQLDQARGQQQDLRGRLASLEALQQAALGRDDGAVSQWLEARGLADAPQLAQQLRVDSGWERAVETALGAYLEAVCIDRLDPVGAALGELESGPLTLVETGGEGVTLPAGQGVFLASKVSADWSLNSLLYGIYAADSLNDALSMRTRLGAGESVITRDGVWIGRDFLRLAKDQDEGAGVLEREKEISKLTESFEQQHEVIAELESALEASREALQEGERQREELQAQVNEAHRERSETRSQLSAKQSRLEQLRQRIERVTHEHEELATQRERDTEEHAAARTRLHAALATMESLARDREQREAQRGQLRDQLAEVRGQAQSERDEAHALAIRIESMRTAQATMEQGLERMAGQQVHLKHRMDELETALGSGEQPLKEAEEQLATMLEDRSKVEAELTESRRQLETLQHEMREQERERHNKEMLGQEVREAVNQLKIAWQEIKVRGETLLEQLRETGFELETLTKEMPAEATIQAWSAQAEQLEQRIQRLGPINLAAIEEFEEESKRKEYLDSQFADLTEALETLENAIQKIDRETRTRFKETFDKVNSGLQEKFPRLFGGGHAYLELTGEDLLDTGVTVMARPPGKRNSTIHLLSGGEKALTAVALVFSIFELNPSPFCMLDEVDAPLDDANVGRFCNMVREMSEQVQFIFITHNKITMELSNQLTGVTMHEPGVSRLVTVDVEEAAQMAAG